MLNVITLDRARDILKERFGQVRTGTEACGILDAVGRVLAYDLIAGEDVPGFRRSMVDGYAVKAADTFGASETSPAVVRYDGEVLMGETAKRLASGGCVYVPTGGEVPDGADAMVMVEDSEDFGDGYRYFSKPAAPGNHLVFRGDDIKQGQLAIPAGGWLKPQDIGVIAALGEYDITVRTKPRVGVISTGDELADTGGATVRDVNSFALCAAINEAGGTGLPLGIVGDDRTALERLINRHLPECDVLLLSGGTSAGNRDYAVAAVQSLCHEQSGALLFHGLAVKPGKPTFAADVNGKPVLGLPGHPAAAFMVFRLLALPLLASIMGSRKQEIVIQAFLSVNVPSNHGREEFVPVTISQDADKYLAAPVAVKSGLISILSQANGYIRIPRDTEGLALGTQTAVYLF